MDCEEYDLPEAVVFNNDNLRVVGNMVYAPVYMGCSWRRTMRLRLFIKWIFQDYKSWF